MTHQGIVKGGPSGRPAGTGAQRRPLTSPGGVTTTTMRIASPEGRGLEDYPLSAAHLNLFWSLVLC